MSVNDTLPEPNGHLAELPTFDLGFALDDVPDPTWVTVYAGTAGEISANWLSIDAAHAVDLDDVA